MSKLYVIIVLFMAVLTLPLISHAEEATGEIKKENLSPEAQAVLKKRHEYRENLSPAVKEELKRFKEERKAAYEKLSPEAKTALKTLREERRAVPQNVKDELKAFHRSKRDNKDDKDAPEAGE